MSAPQPVQYLVARLREALAEDDRTNLLDVQVKIAAGKVFLIGEVGSQELKELAEAAIREILPEGMPVVNELWIAQYSGPPSAETLP